MIQRIVVSGSKEMLLLFASLRFDLKNRICIHFQATGERYLMTEEDAVSETFCLLIFRIPYDGQSSEIQ
jgi:hypothetical protein